MSNKETYSYKGWLISDNFIKRSLATFGYSSIGTLIVYLCCYGIVLTFLGISNLVSWLSNL